MSETDEDAQSALQASVHEALANVFNGDGAMVTRWVLSLERWVSGGKQVLYIAAPDMSPWEVVGMSEMSSELARVQFSSSVLDEMYPIEEDVEEDDEDLP